MFKGIRLRPYIIHSLVAALLYCLPLIFFLKMADYTRAWLLYSGNFLFLLVIVYFLFVFNARRDENAGTLAMLTASSITTIMGTIMALILSLVLLVIFIPGLFNSGSPVKHLINQPANSIHDKTNGLVFMIIANSIIGNVSCGLFAAIIFPFSLKGDQTKEKTPKKKQAEL
jgi:Na+/proline symporter